MRKKVLRVKIEEQLLELQFEKEGALGEEIEKKMEYEPGSLCEKYDLYCNSKYVSPYENIKTLRSGVTIHAVYKVSAVKYSKQRRRSHSEIEIILPCSRKSLKNIPGFTSDDQAKELQKYIESDQFKLLGIWNQMTEINKNKMVTKGIVIKYDGQILTGDSYYKDFSSPPAKKRKMGHSEVSLVKLQANNKFETTSLENDENNFSDGFDIGKEVSSSNFKSAIVVKILNGR